MRVQWMRLGEVLRPSGTKIPVDPAETYEMLGVKSFAKGAFASGTLLGADTAYERLVRTSARQIVYPKLMAWEGAFAVIPDELDGRFVSPEFLCFDVDETLSSHRYIKHLLAWSGFSEAVRGASTGTNARRQRLQSPTFLAIEMPFPARPIQERIADHLDSLGRLRSLPDRLSAPEVLRREWPGVATPVHDLLKPVVRSVAVEPAVTYPLSGVKWYGQGLFIREHKAGHALSSKTIRQIAEGDLVYNRLFAWKQSFALAHSPGWASNEFPTFKVNTDRVRPRVLLSSLLGPTFTDAVNRASTGSTPTSRNRLKEKDFLNLTVTIPVARDQAAIERALLLADQASRIEARRDTLAAAVLPAARNEIFTALR